jgi:hypothetical protein
LSRQAARRSQANEVVTTDGRLKVVLGGGERESKGAHKMKLVFKPTP